MLFSDPKHCTMSPFLRQIPEVRTMRDEISTHAKVPALRRKTRFVVAACAALALTTGSVRAERATLAEAGRWIAYDDNVDGSDICGFATFWQDGRSLTIARWEDEEQLVVQAISPSWTISDERISTTMRIGEQSWTASSLVMRQRNGVEFHIPMSELRPFLRAFLGQDVLTLDMGANSVHWNVGLSGASSVFRAFERCIGGMSR
jgi:hypothetical protein